MRTEQRPDFGLVVRMVHGTHESASQMGHLSRRCELLRSAMPCRYRLGRARWDEGMNAKNSRGLPKSSQCWQLDGSVAEVAQNHFALDSQKVRRKGSRDQLTSMAIMCRMGAKWRVFGNRIS